jgi:chromate transporter
LSFGGAYAAIAQAAHGLSSDLTAAQVLDGIGLSEITPGPLVLGLVFMSFVSAYQAAPEPFAWLWAFGAAGLSAYVIFVPSYMWILWGAPFIGPLTANDGIRRLFNLIACAAIALIALMAWQFITAYLSLMTPGAVRVYESLILIFAAAGLYFVSRRSHLLTLIGLCVMGLGLGFV